MNFSVTLSKISEIKEKIILCKMMSFLSYTAYMLLNEI